MEDALTQLGLNAKETKFYLYLLGEGVRTASQLSKELNENRTNTYMVLDSLVKDKLVLTNDKTPVRTYETADPEMLKELVVAKQQEIRRAHSSLSSILPELSSIYSLGQHKPGVVYLEGLEGYRKSQEDMASAGLPIDVIASNVVPQNPEAERILKNAVQKRKKNGIPARIIFHNDAKKWLDLEEFQKIRGYKVRFWGDEPLKGEVAIYGDKVVLTVYKPSLILTVLTDVVIAQTIRAIFNQIWVSAQKP